MISQYLIHVRDKNQIDFLNDYGSIIHVTKLTGMVVFEGDEHLVKKLEGHPGVSKISKSDKFTLAMQ